MKTGNLDKKMPEEIKDCTGVLTSEEEMPTAVSWMLWTTVEQCRACHLTQEETIRKFQECVSFNNWHIRFAPGLVDALVYQYWTAY